MLYISSCPLHGKLYANDKIKDGTLPVAPQPHTNSELSSSAHDIDPQLPFPTFLSRGQQSTYNPVLLCRDDQYLETCQVAYTCGDNL